MNKWAAQRRLLSHAIFTPGYPGWMDEVDRAIAEDKPDSWKGYTVGDNTHKELSKHPWRMDDEKLVYPFYEKIVKAGYDIVCVHKGLYPPSVEQQFPHLTPYAAVDDVGKAAKDWPQHPLRHLPLGLSLGRRQAGGRRGPSSRRPAASTGPATSPTSRPSTASATSTAISASSSP